MADHPGSVSLTQAAEILGLHYMTVYRYVRTGRLPAARVGRQWEIDPDVLEALKHGSETIRTSDDSVPGGRAEYPRLLENRVVQADEAGAWTLIEDAMASGMDPTEILLDLLGPTLVSIGEGWREGRVSIAEEHQASATVTRLISRLGPRFATRGVTRGQVLVGAAPGDHHGLPSAILRDLLRGRNLSVTDLGADAPAASWADAAGTASATLVAVGIAATAPDNERAIRRTISAVRKVCDAPIFLGGLAIEGSQHARDLGATHHSASTRNAIDLVDQLADQRSARPKGPASTPVEER